MPNLLHAKRMSQVDFARRLDMSEGYVSQIISGKSKFSLLAAKRAAHILGCMVDDLYEWIDDGTR
ncbi:helix-turn-helix protein [compost metagenome]